MRGTFFTTALVILVISSGCLGSPPNQGRDNTETEGTDPEMNPPVNKLIIEDDYSGNFSVVIIDPSEGAVFNESYSANNTEDIDLSGYFPARETRTVEIYINDTRAWRKSIAWYEGYMLEINEDGTIREGNVEV
ncbi:hypothetical protein [Haloferax sulfurifontis]|uniref:Lipoprotein n=1 Tax=Haloferax sulfurifontis TaxID=255616 RepID=A0A830DU27_9EURY|nr:hypothetical protein [Haloferax sulfurifontis]GGC59821.1 hypothetical protein GCM10007209_22410 [Haloferax sulfurifontis]